MLLCLVSCVETQKKQQPSDKSVPDVVLKTFQENNPDAQDAEWTTEGDYFEVEFEYNGIEKEIEYDSTGQVICIETVIETEMLMPAITAYIIENHEGYEIDEVEMLEKPSGVFYEVAIEKDSTEVELIFDEEGNFLEIEEDIDDDHETDTDNDPDDDHDDDHDDD